MRPNARTFQRNFRTKLDNSHQQKKWEEFSEGEVFNELRQDETFALTIQTLSERQKVNTKLQQKFVKKLKPLNNAQKCNLYETNYYFNIPENEKKQHFITTKQVTKADLTEMITLEKDTHVTIETPYDDLEEQLVQDSQQLVAVDPLLKETFHPTQRLDDLQRNIDQFYSTYKQFDKNQQIIDLFGLKHNLQTKILNEQCTRNITPKKIGILGEKYYNPREISKPHLLLGNTNSIPFFSSLSEFTTLKKLNLSHNLLTKLDELIPKLPPTIQKLNLSHNMIGESGIKLMEKIITKSKIKSLDLSYTSISEAGGRLLFTYLSQATSLTKLNLNGNGIGDGCAKELEEFLKLNPGISELYLSYNQIKSVSGRAFFSGIKNNSQLKVIDLRHNGLGRGEATEAICEALQNNHCEIVHLDLGYNHFSKEEIDLIAESLAQNHSIFGFHFQGNDMNYHVNYQGFLVEREIKPFLITEEGESIKGVSLRSHIPKPYVINLRQDHVCWICDGWQQIKFSWSFRFSGKLKQEPIFLHLSFESFKPVLMEKNVSDIKMPLRKSKHQPDEENDEVYQVFRMCPPNARIYYFFSNPLLPMLSYAENQLNTKAQKIKLPKMDKIKFSDGTEIENKPLMFYNYVHTYPSKICESKSDYQVQVKVQPREAEKKYMLNKFQRIKPRQNILFREAPYVKSTLNPSPFDIDYSYTRLNKLARADFDKQHFKSTILKYYNGFRELFKLISVQLAPDSYYVVPYKTLDELVDVLQIFDDEKLKRTDLELDLISLKNIPDLKPHLNPDKALMRFQFIEIIVRIAQDKFLRQGIVKNITEAVDKIMQTCQLGVLLKSFDNPNDWRNERLYTKEVQLMIQIKQNFLMDLFEFIADQSKKKGIIKKQICLYDIQKIFRKLKLITDAFTENDLILMFNQSTDLGQDDYQNPQLRMGYHEFIEFLSRVAEHISPASLGEPEDLPVEERFGLPLQVKMETFLTFIYQNLIFSNTQSEYMHLFNNDNNAVYSMPLSDKVKIMQNNQGSVLTPDGPWSNITRILEQLNMKHSKSFLPVQCQMPFLRPILQKPYIPASFWKMFKNRDPTPIFPQTPHDSETSSEGYQPPPAPKVHVIQDYKNIRFRRLTRRYTMDSDVEFQDKIT